MEAVELNKIFFNEYQKQITKRDEGTLVLLKMFAKTGKYFGLIMVQQHTFTLHCYA